MNVYDFDGTIYDGDSTKDFYRYCLRRHPAIIRFLPAQLYGVIGGKIGLFDRTEMKERFLSFLRDVTPEDVESFWALNIKNIRGWYLDVKMDDDVVISASPEFLIRPACDILGIHDLIASNVDPGTGKFTGENCKGEEKVRRFKEKYGNVAIDDFYSDSEHDLPLKDLSNRSFKVKGDRIEPWE